MRATGVDEDPKDFPVNESQHVGFAFSDISREFPMCHQKCSGVLLKIPVRHILRVTMKCLVIIMKWPTFPDLLELTEFVRTFRNEGTLLLYPLSDDGDVLNIYIWLSIFACHLISENYY